MVMFGQTEAGGCMCLTRRGDDEERVTRSVGAPLPLSEAKVISTLDGKPVAARRNRRDLRAHALRDARIFPDARPRRPRRSMPTAGCTPAISA